MHKVHKSVPHQKQMKILMVCLGNICRSPLAQGILQDYITKNNLDWEVDSAGTSNFHAGEAPDPRAIKEGLHHNINIAKQRSRQITRRDIIYYDLILAMDSSNYNNIIKLCDSPQQIEKVNLVLNYAFPNENREVPDPYYDNSFDLVYKLLEESLHALGASLQLELVK